GVCGRGGCRARSSLRGLRPCGAGTQAVTDTTAICPLRGIERSWPVRPPGSARHPSHPARGRRRSFAATGQRPGTRFTAAVSLSFNERSARCSCAAVISWVARGDHGCDQAGRAAAGFGGGDLSERAALAHLRAQLAWWDRQVVGGDPHVDPERRLATGAMTPDRRRDAALDPRSRELLLARG